MASAEHISGSTGVRSLAFCASTGRTATMLVAKTLNTLSDIVATHEGHLIEDDKRAVLPLVNFHNRKAWYDQAYATRIAATMRSADTLAKAASEASVFVDVAFNNAAFMDALPSASAS